MSTNTIDPLIKIRNLERYACDTALSKEDRKAIFSEMMHRTKVELGEKVGDTPVMCARMIELENIHGYYKAKNKK